MCYYRVETNDGLFGLRKKFGRWKTCRIPYYETTKPAVFDTLSQAENYIEEKLDKIVSRDVVATYK